MKVLFYDRLQDSNADDTLKSPSLSDKFFDSSFTVTLDATEDINCFGIGNTDATQITINSQVISLTGSGKYKNGLYLLTTALSTNTLTISHNGTYIGRLAVGEYIELCLSPGREPGFWNTAQPRRTLSGQVVEGAGGLTGRKCQVEVKYKINKTAFDEMENGYNAELGLGYPLFILFDRAYNGGAGRFPWERLYATTELQPRYQSSVNKFLYSIKFKFEEAY